MNQREIITKWLSSEKIKQQFISSGISHLSLFWSYARNEATKESDLDLLYELDWTFKTTLWTLQYLEDILVKKFKVKKVDFVSKRKINSYLKSYIEQDLINIF
jgi:predicted nucleotidyltransferase